MDQDAYELNHDDVNPAFFAQAETDRLDAAARHIAELALLEARVQLARSCGA